METFKIKMPTGKVFEEIIHYMGADDEQTFHQRPAIAQQLAPKMKPGRVANLTVYELKQLAHEVDNAHNIKDDHVGYEGWTHGQHNAMGKFLKKINNLLG